MAPKSIDKQDTNVAFGTVARLNLLTNAAFFDGVSPFMNCTVASLCNAPLRGGQQAVVLKW